MSPTISVDVSAWQKAAKDLQKTSSRSIVDFINGQAFRVITFALQETKQSVKEKVAFELGQVGVMLKTISKGKRAGKLSRGSMVLNDDLENTLAARILTNQYRKTGQWVDRHGRAVKGTTLAERVQSLIARRVRSVSFIRSGWIPGIKKLSSVIRQKPSGASNSMKGAKQFGVPKGKATPAVYSLSKVIQATVENDIPGHVQGTMDVAEPGLRAAFKRATVDMIETLAKRLKKDLKSFGAK